MDSSDIAGSRLRETVRKRADVLESLRRDPGGKRALVDRLDVSRSTVDRAVESLRETGLIRRPDGQYRVTPLGRLLSDRHREYSEATDALAAAAPLLEAVPLGASVDRSLLETGTIRVADPHAPENAITAAVEKLRSAERLRVFSPVVKSNYLGLVHEEVAGRGLETELVLGRGASESLAALADVTDTVEGLLEAPSVSLYTTDAEVPYMLYLMTGDTDTVGVTVHDEGAIVGSVTSTDPAAVEWGRDRFEDVKTGADGVDGSNLP